MSERLIGPDGLEVDAVVPQCLDNQYASEEVYSDLCARGADYRDSRVAAQREANFKTEFIRPLVYSSQVVIQRAFLKNSDFLYKNFEPETGDNLAAFATLVREKAIVPYLFKERSLRDNLAFDLSTQGDRATAALLKEVGDDATCVRLAIDDRDNERAADSMATEFGSRLTRLAHMTDEQRNAMASELFSQPSRLQEGEVWKRFTQALRDLAAYSFMKAMKLDEEEGRLLTRQDVYRDRFTRGDDPDSVVYGKLKPATDADPFVFELKKYVDLVYNVNLPDHLKRYTFTPAGMPSRMALQDAPRESYGHDEITGVVANDDALDFVRRSFVAQTQRAMALPLLSDLTVADVVKIRELPEWAPFKDAQARILKDPLRCLDNLEDFQRKFDDFQRSLSNWYNKEYQRARTEARYCSFVSFALSLAGKLIIAGSDLDPHAKVMLTVAGDRGVDNIPKKVKGFAAKLMVGVYDLGRRRLDRERTYTVELMQTNAELLREDVVDLLTSINGPDDNMLPTTAQHVADAGTE